MKTRIAVRFPFPTHRRPLPLPHTRKHDCGSVVDVGAGPGAQPTQPLEPDRQGQGRIWGNSNGDAGNGAEKVSVVVPRRGLVIATEEPAARALLEGTAAGAAAFAGATPRWASARRPAAREL